MNDMNNRKLNLSTVILGSLSPLEQQLVDEQEKIESWFVAQWQQHYPPIYGSVDLRYSGFKLAPVDMNLFPAGFNNVSVELLSFSASAARSTVAARLPDCRRILLIPENHTRNIMYWENVASLQTLLCEAGFEVMIGSIITDLHEPLSFDLPSGKSIVAYPIVRKNKRIGIDHFDPDLVWLNNDLTDGVPDILVGLEQAVEPPLALGWHQRLKSVHFNQYQQVTQAIASVIDIDPWLIDPLFQYCGQVDFMRRTGEDCLARNVELLLESIQKKYDQYQIKNAPYVVVKADAGTYGMGVMIAHSADEVIDLNRKQRTKMAASKGSKTVQRVIMQEGIHSIEQWGQDKTAAEPAIYMIGQEVVGGFYRTHKNKSASESLNAPGMEFHPMKMFDAVADVGCDPDRFYAYSVVARLSMLAAARERGAYQ